MFLSYRSAPDILVFIGLLLVLNRDEEQPEFYEIGLAAAGLLVFDLLGNLALAGSGQLGQLAVMVGSSVLTSLIFLFAFNVPPGKSAFAGLLFLVYKIAAMVGYQLLLADAAG